MVFFYDELVNFPQHDTAVVSLCLLYVFIRNIRIFETVDFVFKEHLSCTDAVCRYSFIMTIPIALIIFSPFSLLAVLHCFILGFHDEDIRNKHNIYCFLIYKSGIHLHEKYPIWQMLINVILILHHIFSCKCYLISLLIYCFIIHGAWDRQFISRCDGAASVKIWQPLTNGGNSDSGGKWNCRSTICLLWTIPQWVYELLIHIL